MDELPNFYHILQLLVGDDISCVIILLPWNCTHSTLQCTWLIPECWYSEFPFTACLHRLHYETSLLPALCWCIRNNTWSPDLIVWLPTHNHMSFLEYIPVASHHISAAIVRNCSMTKQLKMKKCYFWIPLAGAHPDIWWYPKRSEERRVAGASASMVTTFMHISCIHTLQTV